MGSSTVPSGCIKVENWSGGWKSTRATKPWAFTRWSRMNLPFFLCILWFYVKNGSNNMGVRLCLSLVQHPQIWVWGWHMVQGGCENPLFSSIQELPVPIWTANSESTQNLGLGTWGSDWCFQFQKYENTWGITPNPENPGCGVWGVGVGCGVWGLRFGVQGLGFKMHTCNLRVTARVWLLPGFEVWGLRVWGLGFEVWVWGFGVWGLGFEVWGSGFRV